MRHVLALSFLLAACATLPREPAPPNVVLILADDLGYGDLGCYGQTRWRTPRLDRLAAEGARCTSYYAAQPVCSASRAALLTGCYPVRIGIHGALGPNARVGIAAAETTLAETLRARGHATALLGKWHLGHLPEFLPTRHGFEEFFGLPYSNDMSPRHPEAPRAYPPLPLLEGEAVRELDPDQSLLTAELTARAVAFIERCAAQGRPFFLMLAHPMPHVPLHAGARFAGRSGAGPYGDVIEELDWSTGQVLDALARTGQEARTLVVFTSDNGPWLSYGDHAGTTGGLREGKGTTFEGGVRVPCVLRWPGRVPAGVVLAEPWMAIDLLPTLAGLAGAPLPDLPIDGRNVWPLLSGVESEGPPPAYAFWYHTGELEAIRAGRFKLHLPHRYRTLRGGVAGSGGRPSAYDDGQRIGLALFDLEADPGETSDVAAAHPEVVARLSALADGWRDELGDALTGRVGRGVREAGRVR